MPGKLQAPSPAVETPAVEGGGLCTMSEDPQNTLGNGALCSELTPSGDQHLGPAQSFAWSERDTRAAQTQLKRLGVYDMRIDGVFGDGTRAGMVEAFGGDDWELMPASEAVAHLGGAKPSGDPKADTFRYGELFKDGLLDVTLGVGFFEEADGTAMVESLTSALQSRGFGEDGSGAAALYAQAGRAVKHAELGSHYVKRSALTFKPPAGPPRDINAVVRLVRNEDGASGKETKEAFVDGMTAGDATYYAGHGRYGSGPDFDRNMSIEVLEEDGTWRFVSSYGELERLLAEEGRAEGRSAWEQLQYRVAEGTVVIGGTNDGNLMLNAVNAHPGEFGAKLMYWALLKSGAPAEAATGADGTLGEAAAAQPEQRYSITLFNGCRTMSYAKSLRATPGMGSKDADFLLSERVLKGNDIANTLVAWLDSVIAQQPVAETISALDAAQVEGISKGAAESGAFGKY